MAKTDANSDPEPQLQLRMHPLPQIAHCGNREATMAKVSSTEANVSRDHEDLQVEWQSWRHNQFRF